MMIEILSNNHQSARLPGNYDGGVEGDGTIVQCDNNDDYDDDDDDDDDDDIDNDNVSW